MRAGILMIAASLAFLSWTAAPVLADDGQDLELKTRFNDARDLAARGQAQDAMSAWAAIIRRWPQLPEAHNNLGVLQMRSGQLAAAETSFNTALSLRPDYSAALENLGDLHARLALAAWEAASRIESNDSKLRDKRLRLLPVLDLGRGVESASPGLVPRRQPAAGRPGAG